MTPPPIFDKPAICGNTPPPPIEKCYNYVCFKAGADSFAGWTIQGVPFNAANLALYFGNGYTYNGVQINPTPPPIQNGVGAIGWNFQPSTDPLPSPTIKDNLGNIINYTWETCCKTSCFEIFIPKTTQRINVVSLQKCQLEYTSLAIQTDPAGSEAILQAMIAAMYPPQTNISVQATGTGKLIKIKNAFTCGYLPELIDDNNNVFTATEVPCV